MRRMKDCGIEWIGEIPEHWTLSKIKYVCLFSPPCNLNPLSPDTIVGYAPMECIKNGHHYQLAKEYREIPKSLTVYVDNDIVMAKVTPCFENGNIAIMSNTPSGIGFGSSELFVFRAKQINRTYLFYWLQNEGFRDIAVSTMTGTGGLKRISSSFITNSPICFPPMKEQALIAAYLDRKCSAIDSVISKQKQLISLLKDYRLSLITEAVTKGLDPDAPMKDSGVEWIGKIPEHWAVIRLKKCVSSIQTGPFGSQLHAEEYIEDGVSVINPANIIDGKIMPDRRRTITDEKAIELARHILDYGDILFARRGEMGKCSCFLSTVNRCICGTGCIKIHCTRNMNPEYAVNQLQTVGVKQYLELNSVGTTMDNLNTQIILEIPLVLPPLEEQETILKYIATHSTTLNSLITRKQSLIDSLTAYKKSLIYETVTGKREVPSA